VISPTREMAEIKASCSERMRACCRKEICSRPFALKLIFGFYTKHWGKKKSEAKSFKIL